MYFLSRQNKQQNELVRFPWRIRSWFSNDFVATSWWHWGEQQQFKVYFKTIVLNVFCELFSKKDILSFNLIWFGSSSWLVSPTQFEVTCIYKYWILLQTKEMSPECFYQILEMEVRGTFFNLNSNSNKTIDVAVCALYFRAILSSFHTH